MAKPEKISKKVMTTIQEQIYNSNEYLPPRQSKHYTIPVICVDSSKWVYYDINESCWYTFDGETIDVERWKFGEPVKVEKTLYQLEEDLKQAKFKIEEMKNVIKQLNKFRFSANEQIEKLTKTFEKLLIDQFVICELRDVWRKRAGLMTKCEE